MSVTEGEDKPLKYPTIFNSADVAVITKNELATAVESDWETARKSIEFGPAGHADLPVVSEDRRRHERVFRFPRPATVAKPRSHASLKPSAMSG